MAVRARQFARRISRSKRGIFRTHADRFQFAHIVHPRENIGPAGAFCQGMKIAHKKGEEYLAGRRMRGTETSSRRFSLQNTSKAISCRSRTPALLIVPTVLFAPKMQRTSLAKHAPTRPRMQIAVVKLCFASSSKRGAQLS